MSESRGTGKLARKFGEVVLIPFLVKYALLHIAAHIIVSYTPKREGTMSPFLFIIDHI